MFDGLISTGLAGLAGGGFGYLGQRETNATNRSIADQATATNIEEAAKNRTFQADQASAQMAFQERMANTAHQREVEDLKEAGLNPIMALNNGSAVPSGASGGGAQGSAVTSNMQNANVHLQGILTTALEGMNMFQSLKKQDAETNFIKAQTAKTQVDTDVSKKGIPKSEMLNDLYDVFRPYLKKAKEAAQSINSWDSYKQNKIKTNKP